MTSQITCRKTLKQIYIANCKLAGFVETDIPDIWKITLEEWLDELNPDEISEDVHDFIMKKFKPNRTGWAKDISPIVWKFWEKVLEDIDE